MVRGKGEGYQGTLKALEGGILVVGTLPVGDKGVVGTLWVGIQVAVGGIDPVGGTLRAAGVVGVRVEAVEPVAVGLDLRLF